MLVLSSLPQSRAEFEAPLTGSGTAPPCCCQDPADCGGGFMACTAGLDQGVTYCAARTARCRQKEAAI